MQWVSACLFVFLLPFSQTDKFNIRKTWKYQFNFQNYVVFPNQGTISKQIKMLETLGIKNRESADSMILALVQFPGATNFVLSRDFLYKKSVTLGKNNNQTSRSGSNANASTESILNTANQI